MQQTSNEQEFRSFAESVRKQALRIVSLSMAGKTQEAAQAALSLASQAGDRRNAIDGIETPAQPIDGDEQDGTDLDLRIFNKQYGDSNDVNPDADR